MKTYIKHSVQTNIADSIDKITYEGGRAPDAPAPLEQMAPARVVSVLDALCALLPAQFEALVFRLGISPAYLSATSTPTATRATEILRWADQQRRLADVERYIAEVSK